MTSSNTVAANLSLRRIFTTWWPLAASWLLMSIELPVVSAVVARLAEPEINLAAYGGIVYPLALIVESPIIMLLSASTALSKDWASYLKLHRFMMVAGALLTALHALMAFTPLYYPVVEGILGAPQEIVEPGRIGLMLMLPWTWSIAYRRFNQGVLIRTGRSRAVGLGTAVRLSVNFLVLAFGYLSGHFAGIVVAASAMAFGVISEAVCIGIIVQPVLNCELKPAPPLTSPLTWREFWAFYIPLVMTSLLTLLVNPIGSAALGRMPEALSSLATWPVVSGLIYMLRSLGLAYNEVVVALLDRPYSSPPLRRFAAWLAGITTFFLLLVAATPLSALWFEGVSALPPHLAELARRGLWIALPLPALSVLQSWYQGTMLYGRRTRGITESVVIYLLTSLLILGSGVALTWASGLYVSLLALTASIIIQTAWLWYRGRPVLRELHQRDA